MTTILLVGAADTGRAPMAAALLRRLAGRRGIDWEIASAGVLGHDDAPPEPEARTTMLNLGLDIGGHRARSLDDALVAEATLLIAVDSGTARALETRFPEAGARTHNLGALAGRQRDIPDPFRMQIGAWMTYARELDAMLEAALERLRELVGGLPATIDNRQLMAPEHPTPSAVRPRAEALGRVLRLLGVLAEMPEVVHWPPARARIENELAVVTTPLGPQDFSAAYGGLLRASLALSGAMPTPGQAAALRDAFARLERAIEQDDLTWLSARIGGWGQL